MTTVHNLPSLGFPATIPKGTQKKLGGESTQSRTAPSTLRDPQGSTENEKSKEIPRPEKDGGGKESRKSGKIEPISANHRRMAVVRGKRIITVKLGGPKNRKKRRQIPRISFLLCLVGIRRSPEKGRLRGRERTRDQSNAKDRYYYSLASANIGRENLHLCQRLLEQGPITCQKEQFSMPQSGHCSLGVLGNMGNHVKRG